MPKKELFRAAVSEALDLPAEIIQDLPRLIITGSVSLFLENHRGILHYDPGCVTVAVKEGQLKVCGESLTLPLLAPDTLEIEGKLSTVEFIKA